MTEQAEVLSAGDARERVAVLEAELAKTQQREADTDRQLHALRKSIASTSTSVGDERHQDALGEWETILERINERYEFRTAHAPVERNQCDGCQAGIQVEGGMHRMGKPGGYSDMMACTAERYGSAPVERVEQEAVQFTVRVCDGKEQNAFEAWAKGRRMDMDVHPLHWLFLNAKTNAARSGWVGAIEYCQRVFAASQQPAPTAAPANCSEDAINSAIQVAFELGGLEDGSYHLEDDQLTEVLACAVYHSAPTAAQDVAGLPFVRKILEKLERFRECAEDDQDADIGSHWLDVLTRLGLLNRVQRSPARWEMTAQADDALETAHQQREGE